MHHAASRLFSVSRLRRGSAEHENTPLSPQPVWRVCFICRVSLQATYAFMHLLPDDDESVGQRTRAGLVLRLRRRVAAEHPLDVEMQHKSQETASLAVLTERCWPVRQTLSRIFIVYTADVWIDLTSQLEERHVLKSWWSLFALLEQFETLKKVTSVWEKSKKPSPGHCRSMICPVISRWSRRLQWSEIQRNHKRWERMWFAVADVCGFPRWARRSLHSDGCCSNVCAAPPGERWWSSCWGAKLGSSSAPSASRASGGGRRMTGSSSLRLAWKRLINMCPC